MTVLTKTFLPDLIHQLNCGHKHFDQKNRKRGSFVQRVLWQVELDWISRISLHKCGLIMERSALSQKMTWLLYLLKMSVCVFLCEYALWTQKIRAIIKCAMVLNYSYYQLLIHLQPPIKSLIILLHLPPPSSI